MTHVHRTVVERKRRICFIKQIEILRFTQNLFLSCTEKKINRF